MYRLLDYLITWTTLARHVSSIKCMSRLSSTRERYHISHVDTASIPSDISPDVTPTSATRIGLTAVCRPVRLQVREPRCPLYALYAAPPACIVAHAEPVSAEWEDIGAAPGYSSPGARLAIQRVYGIAWARLAA